mgnify:CR=1 FL=1
MNKILKLTKMNTNMESSEINEPNQTPIDDIEEELEVTQETNSAEQDDTPKLDLD